MVYSWKNAGTSYGYVDDFSLTEVGTSPTPAPTVTLSASPATIQSGQSSTLTWSSANATTCSASGGWSGSKATSGTQAVSPTANATYTLTCTGAGGSANDSATVTVTTPSQSPYGGSASDVPGTIQAEEYDLGGSNIAYYDTTPGNSGGAFRTDDVDIAIDGPRLYVGWIKAGEWLEYTVDVQQTGTYDLALRVANAAAGGVLHVEVDGVNVSGPLSIPNTGGWVSWQNITKSGISLTAGTRVIRVAFDTNSSNAYVGNLDYLTITAAAPAPTVALTASPATIQSGQSSTLTWSSTNASTCTASGDWSGTKSTSGTQSVSPTANATYTLTCTGAGGSASKSATVMVTVPAPTVALSASPASIESGQSSTLSWTSTNATACSASGDWSGTKSTSGTQSVSPTTNATYTLTCTGAGGTANDSATVTVTQPSPTQAPYGGTAPTLPGTIEAERYDLGGSGVAYYDTTSGNTGGAFRTDDVDVESGGANYNVGWIKAGEWLEYTVNVQQTGMYDLGLRVANAAAGGVLHVEVDGVNVSGPLSIPNTGGWTSWQSITKSGISLTAGTRIVRVAFDTNSTNGYVGNLDYLTFTATGQNLITNPGFESQLSGWSSWGNSSAVTGHAVSGTYSARTGTAAGGVAQEVLPQLTAGEDYRLTFHAKLGASNQQYWVGIFAENSSGQRLLDKSVQISSTSYAPHTIDFTLPSGATTAVVYSWKNAGTSYGYVDDFSLTEN